MNNHAEAITPSDTKVLQAATSYISIGVAGTLIIDTVGGEPKVTITLPAGMYPIRATKVYAASTATGLVGFWD